MFAVENHDRDGGPPMLAISSVVDIEIACVLAGLEPDAIWSNRRNCRIPR